MALFSMAISAVYNAPKKIPHIQLTPKPSSQQWSTAQDHGLLSTPLHLLNSKTNYANTITKVRNTCSLPFMLHFPSCLK